MVEKVMKWVAAMFGMGGLTSIGFAFAGQHEIASIFQGFGITVFAVVSYQLADVRSRVIRLESVLLKPEIARAHRAGK